MMEQGGLIVNHAPTAVSIWNPRKPPKAMDGSTHLIDNGSCPYLEGRRWRIEEFQTDFLDPATYEALLAQGFRRSGLSFYRNFCEGCADCVPLRLAHGSFQPSPSQRAKARRNADLELSLHPTAFTIERYALYRRYIAARHGGSSLPEPLAQAAYRSFLLADPLRSGLITEYRDGTGALLATGYLDLLPEGLSSVYFAFEPRAAKRSLGIWSVLRELELAVSLGKGTYYLGFWVPGSASMEYKGDFRPFEYAEGGVWKPVRDREDFFACRGAA